MTINRLETKPDPTLKDFYQDTERFADLINAVCFAGRKIVEAEELFTETNEETTIFDEGNSIYSFYSHRDIFVRLTAQAYYILIGIENQQNVDVLIALREFLYTAFNYNRQYRSYQRECRKRRKEGLEIKEFKLVPVVTPVIYYVEDEWEENHYISGLMKELPIEWEHLVNDWYTRVVDIKKIDTSLFKNKDNRDLFDGIVKVYEVKGDIEKIREMRVSREVAIFIATITGMKGLVNVIREEESEEIDMCRSWDIFVERVTKEANEKGLQKGLQRGLRQGMERGMAQGISQGISQGIFQGKISVILSLLSQKLGGLSPEIQIDIESCSIEKIDLLTENLFYIEKEQDILNIIH